MQKGNNSSQFEQHPRCSNCDTYHSGRCLVLVTLVLLVLKEGILLDFVLREILVLAKLLHRCRGIWHILRLRFSQARAASQGAHGQGQQGVQGAGGTSVLDGER